LHMHIIECVHRHRKGEMKKDGMERKRRRMGKVAR